MGGEEYDCSFYLIDDDARCNEQIANSFFPSFIIQSAINHNPSICDGSFKLAMYIHTLIDKR